MLFIAEIILTVVAWRKGWRWQALMPLGIGLVIGFSFIPITEAVAGFLLGELLMGVVIELAVILALASMVRHGPKELSPPNGRSGSQ